MSEMNFEKVDLLIQSKEYTALTDEERAWLTENGLEEEPYQNLQVMRSELTETKILPTSPDQKHELVIRLNKHIPKPLFSCYQGSFPLMGEALPILPKW